MKSVLISIQPKWCELIAARRKSLELRKSKPNIPVPFKCYIYQTRHRWVFKILRAMKLNTLADILESGFGMVIGEFACDYILGHCEMANADLAERPSCVHRDKIFEYSGGKEVYGWHISDLRIYDEPKPLTDFYSICKEYRKGDPRCGGCDYYQSMGEYPPECACDGVRYLSRQPQSWCYVEEV